MNYKEIKRKYKMRDADFALIFGYKNAASFRESSAKPRLETAIEILYQKFKK